MAARSPSGHLLSIDIGWFGSQAPRNVLVHSSGIHGVEGFAGSAIQLQLLDRLPSLAGETALIVTHILNPYGMAWIRRTNENNVDLNRNFIVDGDYSGAPANYDVLDPFLSPHSPPSRDLFLLRAGSLILRFGLTSLVQAIGGGQYEYPQGLFFGGKRLEEGLEKYHAFLRQRLKSAERIFGIDVHTGLGLFGRDLLLVEKQDYKTLRKRLGRRVTLLEPERGPAYRIRGGLQSLLSSSAGIGSVQFVIQEFGTHNPVKVLHVLREENRWHHFGDSSLRHPTKARLKKIFFPPSKRWRQRVLARGQDLIEKAVGTLLPTAYS